MSFRSSLTKHTCWKVFFKWSASKVTPSFSVLTHPIYWLTEVESWMISSLVAHWLSRFYCRKFPLRQGVSAYKMVCSSLLHRSEACLFCLHGYAQSQPNLPIGMRKLLFTSECTLHKLYCNPGKFNLAPHYQLANLAVQQKFDQICLCFFLAMCM